MLCLSIRTIRGSDFPSIVDLWNETHPYDPLTPRMFKRKVLLDVNFDPEDFFVAENKEKMVGFVYVVRRLCPLDNEVSPIFTTGWVNGFGVLADAPSETASLLLTKVDCFAKEYGLEQKRWKRQQNRFLRICLHMTALYAIQSIAVIVMTLTIRLAQPIRTTKSQFCHGLRKSLACQWSWANTIMFQNTNVQITRCKA